jgi:hypothetical protein
MATTEPRATRVRAEDLRLRLDGRYAWLRRLFEFGGHDVP